MYKMYLISAEGYKNAKVDFLPKTGKFEGVGGGWGGGR